MLLLCFILNPTLNCVITWSQKSILTIPCTLKYRAKTSSPKKHGILRSYCTVRNCTCICSMYLYIPVAESSKLRNLISSSIVARVAKRRKKSGKNEEITSLHQSLQDSDTALDGSLTTFQQHVVKMHKCAAIAHILSNAQKKSAIL